MPSVREISRAKFNELMLRELLLWPPWNDLVAGRVYAKAVPYEDMPASYVYYEVS